MSEHRGLDHKGVERECVQEWHFCGARDGAPTVGVPAHRDPRYLREFVAWAEGQYPLGTPGHYAVRAVLKGLRSAVYRAKREGRCLLCGGTR